MRKFTIFLVTAILAIGLTGCGKTKGGNQEVALGTVVEAVKTAYGEDYLPTTKEEGTILQEKYGLTEDMYEDIYAEVPMISAQIDTLVAVKCKEGKQQEVVDALNAYKETMANDMMQYPSNQVKLQAARVIEREGFVFYVALGMIPMDVEEQGEEAILKAAQEQNDIAEKAIDSCLK